MIPLLGYYSIERRMVMLWDGRRYTVHDLPPIAGTVKA